MPTGYTAAITENPNLTFKEFVLNCATAFVGGREGDTTLRKEWKEEDSYTKKELVKAKKELQRVKKLSETDYIEQETKRRLKDIKSYQEFIKKETEENKLYEKFLKDVREWNVPLELIPFRDFMTHQINISMNDLTYYVNALDNLSKPFIVEKDWREKLIADTQKEIDCYTQEYAEEVGRVSKTNEWIKAVYDSLEKRN